MVEVLKQPAFAPMNVTDQVLILFAGTQGYLDKVPVKSVAAWQDQFLAFMREQRPEVRKKLEQARKVKGMEAELKAAVEAFQPQFKVR